MFFYLICFRAILRLSSNKYLPSFYFIFLQKLISSNERTGRRKILSGLKTGNGTYPVPFCLNRLNGSPAQGGMSDNYIWHVSLCAKFMTEVK